MRSSGRRSPRHADPRPGRCAVQATVLPRFRARREETTMRPRTPTQQILLIENDSAVRERVLAALAEDDCHVTSVALGEDGVSLAIGLRPDLLVLNLLLPDMAGEEGVRRVRSLDGLALVPAGVFGADRHHPGHPRASAGVV